MLNCEKQEALQAVNEAGFALQELVLSLDTHPCCTAGLTRDHLAKQAYHEAVEAYTSRFGPLQIDQVKACSSWQWIAEPWPWEMED